MPRINIFTLGNRSFGTGHLHRTGWLYEIFSAQPQLRQQVAIWTEDSPASRDRLASLGSVVNFAMDPIVAWLSHQEHAQHAERSICIVDWLDSTLEQVQALRATGARVALLDDYGPAQAEADLVVNSLLAPLPPQETQLGRARLLSGAPYLALSPAVTRLRGIASALNKSLAAGPETQRQPALAASSPRMPGPVHGLLVSSGGLGNTLICQMTLDALARTGFSGQVNVMPAPEERPEQRNLPGFQVSYHPAGPGFHDLLASSDLAILAGGISLYEAVFLGVPTLVVPVTEHQLATARKLAKASCCLEAVEAAGTAFRTGAVSSESCAALGRQLEWLMADQEMRGRMSAAGMQLFDGLGLHRTARAILELAA